MWPRRMSEWFPLSWEDRHSARVLTSRPLGWRSVRTIPERPDAGASPAPRMVDRITAGRAAGIVLVSRVVAPPTLRACWSALGLPASVDCIAHCVDWLADGLANHRH